MTNKATYWSDLLPFLRSRGVDEAVSSVFFRNAPLNRWLRRKLSESVVESNSSPLLADPLFEATFPWKKSGKSVKDLVRDGIISQETAEKIQINPPYKHQLQAFRLLLAKDRCNSIVVASGTGSGKTECFMVPILEDLVREDSVGSLQKKGIRGLFLYPLNALINNQRERLSKLTRPFDGKIRYCLYTGELDDRKSEVGLNYEKSHPEELFSRRAMREKVPHLLITNSSMLERMLLRPDDQPLIESTKKNHTFRWIVLDEAHSYTGTRAAEIALLLRRVLNTFNVDAREVHFIATSATIDAANESAKQQLRRFLADLSGSSIDNIHLVLGERSVPNLISTEDLQDSESLEMLQELASSQDSSELAAHLKHSRTAMLIRNEFIRAPHFLTLSQLKKRVGIDNLKEILKWLDLLTVPEGSSVLLPLRLQLMMGTTDVLNVCPDPNCSGREIELHDPEWHFGQVYLDGRQTCACGAPLFPLAACSHCSAVGLKADLITTLNDEFLVRPGDEATAALGWMKFEGEGSSDLEQSVISDAENAGAENNSNALEVSNRENLPKESSLIETLSNDDDENLSSSLQTHVLITNEKYSPDKNSIIPLFWNTNGVEKSVQLIYREESEDNRIECPACGERLTPDRYYLRRISGQYINSLFPLLLDYCSIPDQKVSNDRPMGGRRILSFTDSRQGTAKTGALIEREGERSFVASRVFKMLAPETMSEHDKNLIESYKSILSGDVSSAIRNTIKEELIRTEAKYTDKKVQWDNICNQITKELENNSQSGRLKNLINSLRTAKTDCTSTEAADILMLREFGSRPVNGANLETCGLIKLNYPSLNYETVPERLAQDFNNENWRNYLKLFLDFFVRTNHAIEMPRNWKYLSGNSKVFARSLLKPGSENQPSSLQMRWPHVQCEKNSFNRIIRLTAKILNINLDSLSRERCEHINDVLDSAFRALVNAKILQAGTDAGSGFRMDFHKSVELVRNKFAWHFEGTNQLFDTIVGSPETACCPANPSIVGAQKITLPSPPEADFELNILKARNITRMFLSSSEEYRKLIESGVWNRYGSYAIEQDGYFSAAEHTAQLTKNTRQSNELDFTRGYINILASSTTMEMGIDLGAVGAVVLNGVPPHPANYLQRIGRAGRRDETRSNAFTICRNRSRDREVFIKPSWALEAQQPALNISLHSTSIVERHITAEVLSSFIMTNSQDCANLTLGEWVNGKYRVFYEWLKQQLSALNVDSGLGKRLKQIVRCSCLESLSPYDLVKRSQNLIHTATSRAQTQLERYGRRIAEARLDKNDAAFVNSLTLQRKRLADTELFEYLTKELVLPSSIRVVNTISFDPDPFDENNNNQNNRSKLKENLPSRECRTGVFEYAPGASIIISGTRYVSGGIKMDWFSPSSQESANKIQCIKSLFICPACRRKFLTPISESSARCPDCGKEVHPIGKVVLPQTFTVSSREKPNKDLSTHQYVRSDPSIYMDESWTAIDRFGFLEARSSDETTFLSLNEGVEKNKAPRYFALCLACGYAQLMPTPNEIDKNPLWWRHYPLQPHGNSRITSDGFCLGNTDGHQFLFSQGISLAAEWKTDCLQLRFSNLTNLFIELTTSSSGESVITQRNKRFKSAGIGIAVAMRHAIAKHFGISEDEINFTSELALGNRGKAQHLVVSLFDRSMGGYCTASTDCLISLFKDAIALLHCPRNCPDACSSCILQFDSERDNIKLDRHDALSVLQAHGVAWLSNEINDLAGSETVPLARPFNESFLAMAEAASQGEAILYVHSSDMESISPATTEVVSLAESLAKLYPRIKTKFAAIGFDWSNLPSEAQNDLHRLSNLNVEFMLASESSSIDRIPITHSIFLNNTESDQETAALIASFFDKDASNHQSACAFVLYGPHKQTMDRLVAWRYEGDQVRVLEGIANSMRLPRLKPANPPKYQAPGIETYSQASAVVVREFSAQGLTFLNFGPKILLSIIQAFDSEAENLYDLSDSTISEVIYSDRYLERAGDIALVLSIFEAIQSSRCGSSDAKYSIRTCVPKSRRYDRAWLPSKLYESWSNESDRKAVFTELSSLASKGAGFQSTPPISIIWDVAQSQQMLRHARILELKFSNGKRLEIFFDQGMGFVKFDESRLDLRTPQEWANWLYRLLSGRVNRKASVLSDVNSWPTNISATWA